MAKEKIAILGEESLYRPFEDRLGEHFLVKRFDYLERINREDPLQCILIFCDFQCNLTKCSRKFYFAHVHKAILFAVVRALRLVELELARPIYFLSIFEEYELSSEQRRAMEIIEGAEQSVSNILSILPSASIFSKIVLVQKEIIKNSGAVPGLKELSRRLGISPSWLSRRFREITGFTLERFIIKNKLCLALWLLLAKDKLIKEISFDLGFKPVSFLRRFKEEMGVWPRYLRSNLAHSVKTGLPEG